MTADTNGPRCRACGAEGPENIGFVSTGADPRNGKFCMLCDECYRKLRRGTPTEKTTVAVAVALRFPSRPRV